MVKRIIYGFYLLIFRKDLFEVRLLNGPFFSTDCKASKIAYAVYGIKVAGLILAGGGFAVNIFLDLLIKGIFFMFGVNVGSAMPTPGNTRKGFLFL